MPPAVAATVSVFAFALPFFVRMLRRRIWGEKAQFRFDPLKPSASLLRDSIEILAERIESRRRNVRLDVFADNDQGLSATIDIANDGEVVCSIPGQVRRKTSFGGRWIADHPLPLVLRPGGKTVLFVSPALGGRFRVSLLPDLKIPVFVDVASIAFATLCIAFSRIDWAAVFVALFLGLRASAFADSNGNGITAYALKFWRRIRENRKS